MALRKEAVIGAFVHNGCLRITVTEQKEMISWGAKIPKELCGEVISIFSEPPNFEFGKVVSWICKKEAPNLTLV